MTDRATEARRIDAALDRARAPRDPDPEAVDVDAERQAVIETLTERHRRATGAPPRTQ